MGPRSLTKASMIEAAFEAAGFDLVRWVAVGDYNTVCPPDNRLPTLGSKRSPVAVVGNTRAIWTSFLDGLRSDPGLVATGNPLDTWVEQRIHQVVEDISYNTHVVFCHDTSGPIVSFQQLGALAGTGFVGPCRLSVHRRFGPWISFRAAVVVDMEPVQSQFQAIDTCSGCVKQPCMTAARQLAQHEGDTSFSEVRSQWEKWLAVRQACPVGAEHAFDSLQSAYHYTHDAMLLAGVLDENS